MEKKGQRSDILHFFEKKNSLPSAEMHLTL